MRIVIPILVPIALVLFVIIYPLNCFTSTGHKYEATRRMILLGGAFCATLDYEFSKKEGLLIPQFQNSSDWKGVVEKVLPSDTYRKLINGLENANGKSSIVFLFNLSLCGRLWPNVRQLHLPLLLGKNAGVKGKHLILWTDGGTDFLTDEELMAVPEQSYE